MRRASVIVRALVQSWSASAALVVMLVVSTSNGQSMRSVALEETAATSANANLGDLGDLDGDADLDLVVGNDRPDDKRIYFNDGEGRFRFVVSAQVLSPLSMAGMVDGRADGYSDPPPWGAG